MASRSVQIDWGEGVEMKSIAMLIQKASAFSSMIHIMKDGRKANAKSLLGMMSLGIEDGSDIEILAEGPDADEAVEAIAEFFENPA